MTALTRRSFTACAAACFMAIGFTQPAAADQAHQLPPVERALVRLGVAFSALGVAPRRARNRERRPRRRQERRRDARRAEGLAQTGEHEVRRHSRADVRLAVRVRVRADDDARKRPGGEHRLQPRANLRRARREIGAAPPRLS